MFDYAKKFQLENPNKISQYNKNRLHKNHKINTKEWTSCKDYFKNENGEWCCAYCGKLFKDHYRIYAGKLKKIDLHKEHVDDKGNNDLSNCVPACLNCNSSKHTYILEFWYNENHPNFTQARLDKINKWLDEGKTILLDRYVYSNIAFQCAKIENEEGQKQLRDWIYNLEFDYFKIPKPTASIFLDVPFNFTESRLKSNRIGDDRDYLKGSVDIHEDDLGFQQRVRRVYLQQPNFDSLFSVVPCTDSSGLMASKNDIFKRIVSLIED